MDDHPTFEITVERMVDGMFELFDELGDLAINRVVNLTRELDGGFNPLLVTPENVNRFKLTWFAALGALMFHEMKGMRVADAKAAYDEEMAYQARERGERDFLERITGEVEAAIAADEAYGRDGIFNRPSGNGGGPKNTGLGPALAAILADVSFAGNEALEPVIHRVYATVEEEVINAYGHATISCGKFRVI